MVQHILRTDDLIQLPQEKVFEFFSDALNLNRITPDEMHFTMITPEPIEMKAGALIDYSIRLNGIPMHWRTCISVWNPPIEFIDEQLSGPYAQWIHHHKFIAESENSTRIVDEVRYRLPLSPLGDIVYPLIRLQLKRIFNFRQKTTAAILMHKAAVEK
jgi:ligand-binding SRPBCC domain-containing protein